MIIWYCTKGNSLSLLLDKCISIASHQQNTVRPSCPEMEMSWNEHKVIFSPIRHKEHINHIYFVFAKWATQHKHPNSRLSVVYVWQPSTILECLAACKGCFCFRWMPHLTEQEYKCDCCYTCVLSALIGTWPVLRCVIYRGISIIIIIIIMIIIIIGIFFEHQDIHSCSSALRHSDQW